MSFSLPALRRKWSCRGYMSAGAAMVTVALVLADRAEARKYASPLDIFGIAAPRPRATWHSAKVPGNIPLPRPRPEEAPKASDDAAPESAGKPSAEKPSPEKPSPDKPSADEPGASKPAEAAPPPEKQASSCRLALTEEIAIAPSIPDIRGPGACGGEDLVRLEAIVLPDKRKVAVKPAAILRCTMASAMADWVRKDMVPLAASLGSTISDLDNFDSFECRGRNRVVGATLSEHGKANALDVRAIKLVNGQSIGLTDRTMPREVRERVLHSVCSRFSTVLGPEARTGTTRTISISIWRSGAMTTGSANGTSGIPCRRLPPSCRRNGPRRRRRARSRPSPSQSRELMTRRRRNPLRLRTSRRSTAARPSRTSRQQKSAGETGAFEARKDQDGISSCPPGQFRRRRAPAANYRASRHAWVRARPQSYRP
ncbi:hypothetical protein ACVWW5_006109 [Bradyrhizobium sp. LM3.4]